MRLTILGSGTLVPVANRCNPGYLLDIANDTILLDSGSGTLRQISSAGRSIWDINKIFYSHLHIDHTNELIPLLFAYKYSSFENTGTHRISINAHSDFKLYFKKLIELHSKWIKSDKYSYEYHEIHTGIYSFDNYKVNVCEAVHTDESLIYRFEDKYGKSFTYSGDTDLCQGIIEASKNVDLLLIECSFPDSYNSDGHMTPKKISELIKESKPKRVLLTHIYPENDDGTLVERISNPLKIPIEVAEDLKVIEI